MAGEDEHERKLTDVSRKFYDMRRNIWIALAVLVITTGAAIITLQRRHATIDRTAAEAAAEARELNFIASCELTKSVMGAGAKSASYSMIAHRGLAGYFESIGRPELAKNEREAAAAIGYTFQARRWFAQVDCHAISQLPASAVRRGINRVP